MAMKGNLAIVLAVTFAATSAYATGPQPSFVDCPPTVAGEARAGAGPARAPDGTILPQPSFVDCPPTAAGEASAGAGPARAADGTVLPQPSFVDCPPIKTEREAAGSTPSSR
jgi:hypothetical protein